MSWSLYIKLKLEASAKFTRSYIYVKVIKFVGELFVNIIKTIVHHNMIEQKMNYL